MKKLKESIKAIAEQLGMTIPNIDETRSRRSYNRYILEYQSVLSEPDDAVQNAVLMETSFAEVSFPTAVLPVHSYIGDMMVEEAPELFDSLELKKIYFIVNEDSNYTEALEIKTRYKNTFLKEHRAVSRGAIKSQKEYSKEIELYDEQKGYFAIVSLVRKLLLKMRWVLGGWTFIKDFVSKEDWVCRRQIVEITALVKMVIPMIVLALSAYFRTNSIINIGLLLVVGYDPLDTVTYLLSLMFFADIQRPSANVSRSLIMLKNKRIMEWFYVVDMEVDGEYG
ncbi:hypothetical protein LI132_04320 [Blautia faecis]|uniref:hypothetical protein n=1 Tax=Blautia faecis TaxID=871665 RepID=UPI001D08BCB7|nr:hypothetical protein [Blautia faecis]MCB6580324.1 hypothetical protein [Blautia faecis]